MVERCTLLKTLTQPTNRPSRSLSQPQRQATGPSPEADRKRAGGGRPPVSRGDDLDRRNPRPIWDWRFVAVPLAAKARRSASRPRTDRDVVDDPGGDSRDQACIQRVDVDAVLYYVLSHAPLDSDARRVAACGQGARSDRDSRFVGQRRPCDRQCQQQWRRPHVQRQFPRGAYRRGRQRARRRARGRASWRHGYRGDQPPVVCG